MLLPEEIIQLKEEKIRLLELIISSEDQEMLSLTPCKLSEVKKDYPIGLEKELTSSPNNREMMMDNLMMTVTIVMIVMMKERKEDGHQNKLDQDKEVLEEEVLPQEELKDGCNLHRGKDLLQDGKKLKKEEESQEMKDLEVDYQEEDQEEDQEDQLVKEDHLLEEEDHHVREEEPHVKEEEGHLLAEEDLLLKDEDLLSKEEGHLLKVEELHVKDSVAKEVEDLKCGINLHKKDLDLLKEEALNLGEVDQTGKLNLGDQSLGESHLGSKEVFNHRDNLFNHGL